MATGRNPFPPDAVATGSLLGLPNYKTRSASEAETKIDNFVEDFDQPGPLAHLTLGIRGRYGSGKTHLALHLTAYLASKSSAAPGNAGGNPPDASPARRVLPSLTLFAKADRPDLYEIYKSQIAGQLRERDLRELIAAHYRKLLAQRAGVAAVEGEREGTLQVTSRVIGARSEADPEYILTLLRHDLLPVGDLTLQLNQELRETENAPQEDFFRAYSKIDHPEFGTMASRWIHGEQLNETEAARLGVTLSRIEPKHAKEALTFLLNAYRRAGVVFSLCLDEFERFRLPAEGGAERSKAANREAVRQVLKDLAEAFQQCGQMLIISGATEAWTDLPEDVVPGRITPANTIDVRMDGDEAKAILQEYCRAGGLNLTNVFESGALKRLLEVSECIPRRTLQIAHHAYAFAEPYKRAVAERDVPEAAAKALGDKQRTGAVQDAIRAVGVEFGLAVQASAMVEGRPYAFSIGDPTKPIVLVDILRSFFKLEEVEDARFVAATTPAVVSANPHVQTCAVIVGYSSSVVRAELAKTTRVFVFDEDQFAQEFREFLRKASTPTAGLKPPPTSYRPEEYDRLARESRVESERLTQGITQLSARSDERKEVERVERVSGKLSGVIGELRDLLQEEEDCVAQSKSVNPSALALLERQKQSVTRALRLNEGQPREHAFELQAYQELLKKPASLIETELGAPHTAVRSSSSTNEDWLKLCKERQRMLRDIRKFQDVRTQIAGLGVMSAFGPLLWSSGGLRACMAVGILWMGILIVPVMLSWSDQKLANVEFLKALNGIEAGHTEESISKALDAFEESSPLGSPVVKEAKGGRYNSTTEGYIRHIRQYFRVLTILGYVWAYFASEWHGIPLFVAFAMFAVPLVHLISLLNEG